MHSNSSHISSLKWQKLFYLHGRVEFRINYEYSTVHQLETFAAFTLLSVCQDNCHNVAILQKKVFFCGKVLFNMLL